MPVIVIVLRGTDCLTLAHVSALVVTLLLLSHLPLNTANVTVAGYSCVGEK